MGKFRIGMVGLGVMGRNLLLNMATHGFSVAGFDMDITRVRELKTEAEHLDVAGVASPGELMNLLREPRTVLILVPAGEPVDAVIREILPYLVPGDIVIDGGNSFYRDTDLREKTLADKGIAFLGVGFSGGEAGARHGPCIMPGGLISAYEHVRQIFEAIAARASDGQPCVTYLGPHSAGHYVKMVHNGIEYGLLQAIAETYDLMKRGLGLTDDELHDVYNRWNQVELQSYLIEITARIFNQIDDQTGARLIDVILDEAKQKGTGMWAGQEAMELQIPTPVIHIAVAMRNLSAMGAERTAGGACLLGPPKAINADRRDFIEQLASALYFAMIVIYAQGMALLRAGSTAYKFDLKLEDIARIWRAGCIIRSALLEKITEAFRCQPQLANLMMDGRLSAELMSRQNDLRAVVSAAVHSGIPAPAFMATLAYFDSYRSSWLPASLIQAQRDYFGAHTYERSDARGAFHTRWNNE